MKEPDSDQHIFFVVFMKCFAVFWMFCSLEYRKSQFPPCAGKITLAGHLPVKLQGKKISFQISMFLKNCIVLLFEFTVTSIEVLRLMLLQFFEIHPEVQSLVKLFQTISFKGRFPRKLIFSVCNKMLSSFWFSGLLLFWDLAGGNQ